MCARLRKRWTGRSLPAAVAPIVVLALLASSCTGGSDDGEAAGDGSDRTDGLESTDQPSAELPPAAFASVEFVNAVIADQGGASYIATTSEGDAAAAFDPELVSRRLDDLRAFAGIVENVVPSTIAYPGADNGLGPACGRSAGVFCQVDLAAPDGEAVASVVVYWFGDGVTDFSIVARSRAGGATGIGIARCSPGFSLVHGGHTDRFDVAICGNESGELEYSGAERGTDLDIRLEACQDGPDRWVAVNEGFRYEIDGSSTEVQSSLEVRDPRGDLASAGAFLPVELAPAGTPRFCS